MIVVGITGASGVIYGKRICEELAKRDKTVGLVVTEQGKDIICRELKIKKYSKERIFEKSLQKKITEFSVSHMAAPIASGSFPTTAMVIAPCSVNTLGAIAAGICDNLLLRTAQVTLKEGRKLLLLPRETPLGVIQLRNMLALCEAGAFIVPPCPGFYHNPETMEDLIDFTVARVLNLLGIKNDLLKPWGSPGE